MLLLSDLQSPQPANHQAQPYRVLARKYRPRNFDELIGQEAMVRTLSNAMESGRLAHAFVLTGVRGIGKTTTARIIARALNCIGLDGKSGPTINPCGQCENCRAIAEDRHVDVLEMDAASRTGVDDIREIIDGVRYSPASARYKIYIIDEVHMLSKNAFNALLKTLEEPPPHVKFIFATTEIRKVPITVLSRCQRFDLKRIDLPVLVDHLTRIAAKENVMVEPAAVGLIARAAEGSVRDSLSLMDQAIAHGNGAILESHTRDMLGLADRSRVLDLFDKVMEGKIADALIDLQDQYRLGADPITILGDLLEISHWLTRLKIVPQAALDNALSDAENKRGLALAETLPMPVLTRAWQMLLKGLDESRQASSSLAAAEMTLVRLAYVADLPTPGDLIKQLTIAGPAGQPTGPLNPSGPSGGHRAMKLVAHGGGGSAAPNLATASPMAQPSGPLSFPELVALCRDKGEFKLAYALENTVGLVRFDGAQRHIEWKSLAGAAPDLPQQVQTKLHGWTGQRWLISLSSGAAEKSIREQKEQNQLAQKALIEQHPMMQALRMNFGDAKIIAIHQKVNELPVPSAPVDVEDLKDQDIDYAIDDLPGDDDQFDDGL